MNLMYFFISDSNINTVGKNVTVTIHNNGFPHSMSPTQLCLALIGPVVVMVMAYNFRLKNIKQ